ncbi:hypothetical protein BDY21DRAFT_285370 [Lineolata rhizophorae]|uniref:Uncharacterized protein n=1 Tax=Lineolata rhizophorae TaxID=578093 RepID=A0A6A6P1I7_9PEZI|nr:hypothetical protein BDY21DRAFT_285370 [Lineolata rhizophorae]
MTSKDSSLYGIPRPKKATTKEISSSSTLAFTSNLSNLIASSRSRNADGSTAKTAPGRARPPKKGDIFTQHNKGSKKRALKDLEEENPSQASRQKHTTHGSTMDADDFKRSRRKMEEKARLYAAMKRGDVDDEGGRHMVDFDRKWAEKHASRDDASNASTASDSDDGDDDDDEEEDVVEYTDEFGRTRRGTRAQAAREERRKRMQTAAAEDDRFSARPAAPTSVIYGDTVQSEAWNPDARMAAAMADLAAKRDRATTPPPDEHFDGSKEVRTKGVSYFRFSQDEETRKEEMEALERERRETEKAREERDRKREERRKLVEEKRKAIGEKRGKAKADKFLNELMGEFDGNAGAQESRSEEQEDLLKGAHK